MSISGKWARVLFGLLGLAYSLYAIAFIYRSSFIINGERYFVLFDDAMISMQYAKNLAHGYGLVWNAGDAPVEGYTNTLWVLFMTLVHLLPIATAKISLVIQVVGALCLAVNLIFVVKLAKLLEPDSHFVALVAAGMTAFYGPLAYWSLMGMEVGILSPILTIAAWRGLQCLRNNASPYGLYLLLGVSTWIRIDMLLPGLVIVAFLFIFGTPHNYKTLAAGLLILSGFMLTQTVLRLGYFGDLLPNTYYLKMTGYPILGRMERGLADVLQWAGSVTPFVLLIPFAVLLVRRHKEYLFPAVLFLTQVSYHIYVGGDAWSGSRYITTGMPLLFVLFGLSVYMYSKGLLCWAAGFANGLRVAQAAPWLVLALSTIALNRPIELSRWLLIRLPSQVQENADNVRYALLLNQVTDKQARIAVTWAGAIPYFADRPAVDILGKTDRLIAHEASHNPQGGFRPGHTKWDYPYTIGELRPDVVAQLWSGEANVTQYLGNYRELSIQGFTFYVRKDSTLFHWTAVHAQR